MIHETEKWRRMQRENHIRHRENILRHRCSAGSSWTPVRGSFNKGKVHCSCWLCSFHEYTKQDRKRAASMLHELEEENLMPEAASTIPWLKKSFATHQGESIADSCRHRKQHHLWIMTNFLPFRCNQGSICELICS